MDYGKAMVVGDYVVGEWLMDNIYAGTNPSTGEQVAIKIIEKEGLASIKQKRISFELAVVQKLWGMCPQGFEKVLRLEDDDKHIFVITEWLGHDLLSFLACKGRIMEREVKLIFGQLCKALRICHSVGITHHGLSLDNIWVNASRDQELETKISGFGRCCIVEREGELLSNFEDCLNQYAPPEIFKGQKYDGRGLDVYALGVVLYALLVGDLPFADEDLDLQIEQKLSKNFLSSMHFPTDVSTSARELVFSILRPNPAKRATLDQILQHPFFSLEQDRLLIQKQQEKEEAVLRLFEGSSPSEIHLDANEEEAEDVNDVQMGASEDECPQFY